MCPILVSVKFQAALLKYFPAISLKSTGGRIKQAQAQFEANLVSAKLTPPKSAVAQFCTELGQSYSFRIISFWIFHLFFIKSPGLWK